MGFFSRRTTNKQLVPAHVLGLLAEFGDAELAGRRAGRVVDDPRFSWDEFHSPVCLAMANQANRDRVIQEIYDAALSAPNADLATIGGYLALAEFDFNTRDPRFLHLLDASLSFMQSQGFSSGHLRRYEADRWLETHDDLRTSFDRLEDAPIPSPGVEPQPKELRLGEARLLATMGPGETDNRFFAERQADGYVVYSERLPDADARTRARYDETSLGSFASLSDLLRALGQYLGSPTFWADEDLTPYFPVRRF